MTDNSGTYYRQLIDANCNDCKFMVRDIEKRKSFDHLHQGQLNASHRLNYGTCTKFKQPKPVNFIPNWCQVETQDCFKHRKD